jgi:molybdopterin synthase catalytic subunit
MADIRLIVDSADFDPGAEIAALGEDRQDIGAVASFVGLVRGAGDGALALTIEHYPGMTEKQIMAIIEIALGRWRLDRITVIHRVGRLMPGARIVFVGVASAHRGEAFSACEFLIDWLKTKAPFWKMEETGEGDRWVEAKAEDDRRADRWQARADCNHTES